MTDRNAVLRAIAQYDQLGQDRFLARYGFERARVYFLEQNEREYDAAAILAAARNFQVGRPLASADLQGEAVAALFLRKLGFRVVARGSIPTVTRDSVERALTVASTMSNQEFLSSWKQREASKFEILWQGRRFPAKAVLAVAEHLLTGRIIRRPGDWKGSSRTVAAPLRDLGFEVVAVGNAEEPERRSLKLSAAPPLTAGSETRAGRQRPRVTSPDYVQRQVRASEVGWAGELAVLESEYERLAAAGRDDLAQLIRHVADPSDLGDGAGFDILSFNTQGQVLNIEVKTTVSNRKTEPFFMSVAERQFLHSNQDSYRLYRLYGFDVENQTGAFFVLEAADLLTMHCEPTNYVFYPGARDDATTEEPI